MDGEQKISSETERNRVRGRREVDVSLWSPVQCSCHPLFIALFLVLQPGVGHRITSGRGDEGGRMRVGGGEPRTVTEG